MRKSVHYNIGDLKSNLYLHMFREDISLGIMPFVQTKSSEMTVEVLGDENEKVKVKNLLSSLSRYSYERSIDELIANVITHIASSLARRGVCFYEINAIEDDKSFDTFWIPPKNIYRLFKYYIQLIPHSVSKNNKTKSIIPISASSIWKIKIPKSLGGPKEFRKMLKRLINVNPTTPKFADENILSAINMKAYSFDLYTLNTEILVNKIVHRWNWNRRDLDTNRATEFYSIYKHLMFKLSQSILREHILREINSLFKQQGINGKIIISGLNDSEKLFKLSKELIAGTKTLNDVP